MAKTIELAIDVPTIVSKIAEQYDLNLPSKIVMFHYDDSSDILYVHFEYPAKSVDSRIVDKHGEIVLGLSKKGKILNLLIINAATNNPP
jgi:uncharacterized protein YuzE